MVRAGAIERQINAAIRCSAVCFQAAGVVVCICPDTCIIEV